MTSNSSLSTTPPFGQSWDPEELRMEPIWELRTGLIVGAELPPLWDERIPGSSEVALERVRSRGKLFADLAGLLFSLDRDGLGFKTVALNLPWWLLAREDSLTALLGLLRHASLGSARWLVDIRAVTFGGDRRRSVLQALRGTGVEVALDHVGMTTQLATLQTLDVRCIKVDASVIEARERSRLQEILEVGREIRARVVGLGVHVPGDAEFLKQLGCRYGQGRLFLGAQPLRGLLRWAPGQYAVGRPRFGVRG